MTKAALVIVDVQNDFIPGGSLPVPAGDEVVPVLNRYVERFQAAELPILATRDWHPPRTTHFRAFGGAWPQHCVQGTRGAEFHPDLRLPESAIVISKGMGEHDDAYSGFQGFDSQGEPMAAVLRRLDVDHLYLGGLATDYCDQATALSGLAEGFPVTLLIDAVRGINLKPGDIERAIAEMVRAGANVTTLERLNLETEDRETADAR